MPRRTLALTALLIAPALFSTAAPAQPRADALSRQVEIRRTAYGIPHISAENLRAAGYALGWVQMEDYGERVVRGIVSSRGEMGVHYGRDAMEPDFANRLYHRRAEETYPLLSQDLRDVLEGFAAGVNRWVELHPEEFPATLRPTFTGVDVHAVSVSGPNPASARRLVERLGGRVAPAAGPTPGPEDGSNVWAFAPSRTRSGHAILMRNPHLSWEAGYYEGHLTVPGVIDFYGDFRIGSPIGIIGGFNRHLGWATTNNAPDTDEIYALDVDPHRPDHYLFDGGSQPLRREVVTAQFRNGPGIGTESREFWFTSIGPVVHRDHGYVYVLKAAGDGEHRGAEMFLRMMRASTLEQWKDAMRMLARNSSNFTYADDRGNIFYVWNANLPRLPHPWGADTVAIHARSSADVWSRLVPFDSLPQLLNPPGGYLRNENDEFHFTNLNRVLRAEEFPPNIAPARLWLRSQHSVELVHDSTRRFSLEEVVALKHSMRMLLADRVKDDLLAAVTASNPSAEVAAAAEVLRRWDNMVAADSRGAVLFENWWRHYAADAPVTSSGIAPGALFREPWNPADPMHGPRGIGDPARAAEAFVRAVEETRRRWGAVDVPWGEVHRVRRGSVDVPVGGCSGQLGCFRVLQFEEAPDGRRVVNGGDGWLLAVEFGPVPRAYTVLAYGQSNRPDSPHFDDQAVMFAENRVKPVAFTEDEIARQLIRSYRPGEGRAR